MGSLREQCKGETVNSSCQIIQQMGWRITVLSLIFLAINAALAGPRWFHHQQIAPFYSYPQHLQPYSYTNPFWWYDASSGSSTTDDEDVGVEEEESDDYSEEEKLESLRKFMKFLANLMT